MNILPDAENEIGGLKMDDSAAHASDRVAIPQQGRSWCDVRADLVRRKAADYDWRAGRLPLYVYHDGDELLSVTRDAYDLYFSENALGGRAFPSLAGMEREIVQMSLGLFHAPEGADGSFTTGGTESIFLALKTARDFFRARSAQEVKPKVVMPVTAHPAFDKAAHYLGIDVVRVRVASDLRVDLSDMNAAVDGRTMMIVGSAPCYPYGVYDSIAQLGELAQSRRVWLHVDACLGGFLAPFVREEGYSIPEFDFTVPGVASLSADLHKHGFAARGASVILYRLSSYKAYQTFEFNEWPRGTYCTETFPGSRPGGAIASAWAVLQYLGREGYRRLARKTMSAKERLVRGIEAIPGMEVLSPSDLSILVYRSRTKEFDIDAVAEELTQKGWFVGRTSQPRAIHFAVNAVHAPVVEEYLRDLKDAVRVVRRSGRVGHQDDRTY